MKTNRAIQVSCLLATMCIGMTGVSRGESKLPDPDGEREAMVKLLQGE